MKASGLEYVIFRPSFVFGRRRRAADVREAGEALAGRDGDRAGTQRIQPIWVEDVAQFFATAVDDPRAPNRTFELGGPDVVTWNELYLAIAKVLGKRRRLRARPVRGRAGRRDSSTEWAPGAPLTADQVDDARGGATTSCSNADAVETFDLRLVSLDEQIRRARLSGDSRCSSAFVAAHPAAWRSSCQRELAATRRRTTSVDSGTELIDGLGALRGSVAIGRERRHARAATASSISGGTG